MTDDRAKSTGLTEAVHEVLQNDLGRGHSKHSKAELAVAFCRALRARGKPEQGLPSDKVFFDDLSGDL